VSEFKVGDKVWAQATVQHIDGKSLRLTFYDDWTLWFLASDCRPVEPVIKECLTTKPNCSEIPNSSSDPINPSHYKHLPAEAIDIIMAAIANAPSNQYAFLQGQVIKYVLRCWSKKGIEDLRKAKWYLDRLVGGFNELLTEASVANDRPAGKRYRTPTLDDLANGPIACECRDHASQDWKNRMLTKIADGPGYPFLCFCAGANKGVRYAECRIEVGE